MRTAAHVRLPLLDQLRESRRWRASRPLHRLVDIHQAATSAPRRGADQPYEAVLAPIQQGFMNQHGLQCGFCTPAMMMTGQALIDRNPDPTNQEIREAICGTICRCTGYENIVRAIHWAANAEAEIRANKNVEVSA